MAGRVLDCLHYRDGMSSFKRYCIEPPYDADNIFQTEKDVIQSLTGVADLHWEMKGLPIRYKVFWKVVPTDERIPLRLGARS